MSVLNLGRLEKVDVRTVWTSEPTGFTPWLASESNLALLGEVIGIDLILEAQEKYVGPFRADILCKDAATEAWVLIENQLERTDHTHLGQLMTYAAGLNAVTIVWISQRFTDEHRAALDWLNTITAEGINFFGLEIELWRIGNSAAAPKFNIVSKPNDWRKSLINITTNQDSAATSELGQLQIEYWSAFRAYMLDQQSPVKPLNPKPQHWMNMAIGRSNFSLSVSLNSMAKSIAVSLDIYAPNAKPHFFLLRQQKEAIEHEVGVLLEWQELPNKQQSRILLRNVALDPTNRAQWPDQHTWLKEYLERFRTAFGSRVKQLNAGDYVSLDLSEGDAPLTNTSDYPADDISDLDSTLIANA